MAAVEGYLLDFPGGNPPVFLSETVPWAGALVSGGIQQPGQFETVPWAEEIAVLQVPGPPVFEPEEIAYPGPRVTHYHRLGAGMVRPFVRTFHRDIASSQGTDVVLSNVGQVFGTKAGSLPWRPEFGSQLDNIRHKANTIATRELAGYYARQALSRWEPRAVLRGFKIDSLGATDANQIVMHARVAIEGQAGEHALAAAVSNVVDRPAGADPLGYGPNGARVPRGLGYLTDPPKELAPPVPILGGGLMRPFYRSQDFMHGTGVPEILSNVGQVLGTAPGTLPWRPELGCALHRLRHRANKPGLRELASLYVEQALSKWEPRAQLTKAEALTPKATGRSELTIRALCKIGLFQDSGTHPFEVTVK